MRYVCHCRCHTPTDEGFLYPVGVLCSDVIEAAAACDVCVNKHCAALLNTALPSDERRVAAYAERETTPVWDGYFNGAEGPEA